MQLFFQGGVLGKGKNRGPDKVHYHKEHESVVVAPGHIVYVPGKDWPYRCGYNQEQLHKSSDGSE